MRCCVFLFLSFFIFSGLLLADEGDFWRDKEREKQGWVVIDQDFSHIIYQAPDKELWTRCHSCNKFIKLEDAHKMIIDGRKTVKERFDWDYRWRNRSIRQRFKDWITGKRPPECPMITMVGDRILDYEELYYCNFCYNPTWE